MTDNKLIAEFMGVKYPMLKGSDLQYHTSWDWLMPVVDKIESLGYDTELVNRLDDGGIYFCINDSAVKASYGKTKIEATYDAVVEFIKTYNDE